MFCVTPTGILNGNTLLSVGANITGDEIISFKTEKEAMDFYIERSKNLRMAPEKKPLSTPEATSAEIRVEKVENRSKIYLKIIDNQGNVAKREIDGPKIIRTASMVIIRVINEHLMDQEGKIIIRTNNKTFLEMIKDLDRWILYSRNAELTNIMNKISEKVLAGEMIFRYKG